MSKKMLFLPTVGLKMHPAMYEGADLHTYGREAEGMIISHSFRIFLSSISSSPAISGLTLLHMFLCLWLL